MNNEIREKLGIIPDDVIWGGKDAMDVYNMPFKFNSKSYESTETYLKIKQNLFFCMVIVGIHLMFVMITS